MKTKKRFYVEPCDNCGSIDPPPPRDRTWVVVDRNTTHTVASFDRRRDARAEAAQLNAEAAA